MRVVLHTNIVISAYLSPHGFPARIRTLWHEQVIEVVLSEELLSEYHRVLAYEKIARVHGMSASQIAEEIAGIRQFGILIRLPAEIPTVIPDDPADDIVVATAYAGNAVYIVTGDDHLLRVGQFGSVQVLPPAAFVALMNTEDDEL
jgi:uncharacterized protein